MSEFVIEKGVPLPPQGHNGGRPRRYPFGALAVGDSFFVPGPHNDAESKRLRAAMRSYGHRWGQVFALRAVADGHRIWRVS